jgi:ATP-dependent RNA helicase HelY
LRWPLPGKFLDVRLVARLTAAPASNVDSQIRINFSMVLNLLLSHTPSQVEDLLLRSFAAFQQSKPGQPASARRLVDDFRRHLTFLQSTGYVDSSGELTADGHWASQLRIDQPLLVAEGFRRGLFDGVSPQILAGLMAPFAYDRESDDRRTFGPVTADDLVRRLRRIRRVLSPFAENMRDAGFEVRPLLKRPAIVAFSWSAGVSWEALVRMSDYSEGDLSMLMLRTADNLRHVRALGDTFPDAAAAAADAIDSLMRDPIDTGSGPLVPTAAGSAPPPSS